MKVGLHWLKDYLTIPWDVSELAGRLTAAGTAVDKIEPVFERFTGVVAARIVSLDTLPGRPDLRVLVVDDGVDRPKVICGAPNVRQGLVVPLARPGARLPGLAGIVAPREYDGVMSQGVACSERDLGLSEDHGGLMELDAEEYVVGRDLWDALQLDEVSLSFELTPNRSDCLSVIGIAREIGALVGSRLRRPDLHLVETPQPASGLLSVRIDDPDGCLRYAGRLVRNGRIRPSPFWLRRRLHGAGMRAINNAVDITNFVMLETGQPLHAFDWSKITSGAIVVRAAQADEEFFTLDGRTHRLPADAVMITDGGQPVAIGGIMGGRDSEVSDRTTDFLIESACFRPQRIRRTRKRLDITTESSTRFERGVDPNGVAHALDRAATLFAQLAGAEVMTGQVDVYPNPVAPLKLELDAERVNRFLGTKISTPQMIDCLAGIEFGVAPGKPVVVTVPTFRPDVTREVDLAEEIARLYGYDKVPVNRRAAGLLPTHRSATSLSEGRIRDIVEGMGFTEIVCGSMIDPKQSLGGDGQPIPIRNPLSNDLAQLRTDMIGTLLPVIAHNLNRRVDSIAVYEIGKSYSLSGGDSEFAEKPQLLLALCGQVPSAGWTDGARTCDLFDLKGTAETLLSSLDRRWEIKPAQIPPFAADQCFGLHSETGPIAALGQIDPAVCRQFGVKEPVWAFILDLDPILTTGRPLREYKPLPRFPAVYRDLAVVVDETALVGDLQAAIAAAGGPILESCRLFDRYSGDPIPKGKVNMAFSLVLRHPDRTLTDEEADRAHADVVHALERRFAARLRE